MPSYDIREASMVLGVSDDTVRRWIANGRLSVTADGARPSRIEGADLARLAVDLAATASTMPVGRSSARNRLQGIITQVTRDQVMAQVEMQCGPYRISSLVSREAADDLGLEPGVVAIATVKSTNIVVELPAQD